MKDFDDELAPGRKDTLAGKSFDRLRQSLRANVLVEVEGAFRFSDHGWRVVMNARESLPSPEHLVNNWHDVSSSSSIKMLGLMMTVNLNLGSFARRILPPVPLDQ